jgi:hypothetical protein
MALTKDDLQLIKQALQPQFNNLAAEMDKRFDQVDQRLNGIDHRLEGIDKVLNDLVQAVTVEGTERYADHEERIKALEHAQHTT